MTPKNIAFYGLILASGVMISLTYGGAWFSDIDIEIANQFTVWKQVNILGIWSTNILNIDFFIGGAKALMMMDFAFFTGSGQIIQWFMFFIFGLALLFGFFSLMLTVLSGIFRR